MVKHRLAVGVDDGYVDTLLIALYSAWLAANQPFQLIVGFVPSELSSKKRKVIAAVMGHLGVPTEFIEVQLPSGAIWEKHISPSSYTRIALADVLEETFVWVDCDVILEPGWDELLSQKATQPRMVISAVRDEIINNRPNSSGNKSVVLSKGNYFNSGLMLVDAKAWSEKGFDLVWKDALSRYTELGFQYGDQCVLNYTAAGHVSFLEPKFNVLELLDESIHKGESVIRHYAGNIKPWHYSSEWDYLLCIVPFRRKAIKRFFETRRRLLVEIKDIPEIQNSDLGAAPGKRQRPRNFTFEHFVSALRRISRFSRRIFFRDR